MRCRGASCRGSTPAAGTRRSTPGEMLPTFASIARWARAHGVALQRRDQADAGPRARDGRRRGARRRVALARRRGPAAAVVVRRGALEAARDAVPAAAARAAARRTARGLARRACARLDCVALDANHAVLDRRDRRAPRTGDGYRVCCYTPNDPARVAELGGWGVDTIITDAVDQIHRRDRRLRPRPACSRRPLDVAFVDRQVEEAGHDRPARSTGTRRGRSSRSGRSSLPPEPRAEEAADLVREEREARQHRQVADAEDLRDECRWSAAPSTATAGRARSANA